MSDDGPLCPDCLQQRRSCNCPRCINCDALEDYCNCEAGSGYPGPFEYDDNSDDLKDKEEQDV